MGKRILLCLSHAIEEYQQLDLLHSLGYEVASLGAYIDPTAPHVDIRPPLTHVPRVEAIFDAAEAIRPDEPQEHISPAMLDWLGRDGIIVFHHLLHRLFAQWGALRDWRRAGGRVIWRSVGQSVANNEREASPFRMDGLERVAYSPLEANIPGYIGHDALIRFWGQEESEPWDGWDRVVINVSQHLRQRDPFTNWTYWDSATRDLPRVAIGPGSEVIGGIGRQTPERLRAVLLDSRAFLFTGTQPASYTLGLVEALHAGIPTVSIGPAWMRVAYDGHTAADLFEGHLIAPLWSDDPNEARHMLRRLLHDDGYAREVSAESRRRARLLFDRDTVGAQWREYLG